MYFSSQSHGKPRLPLYASLLAFACVLILVANGISLYLNLSALQGANREQVVSSRAVDKLQYLNVVITDAESSLRGYFLSGSASQLGPWRAAPAEIEASLAELEGLLADSPGQLDKLAQLRTLLGRRLGSLNALHEVYDRAGLADIVKISALDEDPGAMDEIRLLVVIMVREESELIGKRAQAFYQDYQRAVLVGIAISLGAILVLGLFYKLVLASYATRVEAERALQHTNDNLETTVALRTEQLSVLSRHLISIAEVEKARLARELHDEMGANLTAISMHVMAVAARLRHTQPEQAATLDRARATLADTVELKRRIIEDLRPSLLDNLGLAAALDAYCKDFAETSALACDLLVDGDIDRVAPASSIAVFRIVQESLNNVAKYAGARQVTVRVTREGELLDLEVADDGIGIDREAAAKPRSHGLVGMRERALLLGGSFRIERGADDRGTRICVTLPAGERAGAPGAAPAVEPSELHPSAGGHTPSSPPCSIRPHTLPGAGG